jgi:prepilin signal peptidase PulO-like enzyme (type II secretory pathway)
MGIAVFCVWLVMLTMMTSLIVFDIKWQILPDRVTYPLIGLATASKLIQILYYQDFSRIYGIVLGVAVGAGLFLALYIISSGRYIGGGDVKLGIFYGVLLGSGFKSLLVIALGSMLGTILVLPSLLGRKIKMQSQIPFGPSLIVATFIVYIFGDRLVELLTSAYLFP